MKKKFIIYISVILFCANNASGQATITKVDTMKNGFALKSKKDFTSSKMVMVIDTLVSFDPIDYSSTETISQYEVPEEVAKYCNEITDYSDKEALLKKFSMSSKISRKECPPAIIKKN